MRLSTILMGITLIQAAFYQMLLISTSLKHLQLPKLLPLPVQPLQLMEMGISQVH